MRRKRIVITTNKEIYSKLNMLTLTPDVVIKTATSNQIDKIISNINKYAKIIDCERIGDYFILKKTGPLDFSVYFRDKK